MGHPALQPGRTAVITGAASGIGLAAAKALAARGLNLVLADRAEAALDVARDAVAAAEGAARWSACGRTSRACRTSSGCSRRRPACSAPSTC